jgi:hypothetical protein
MNLQELLLVSGQKTISGRTVLHPGISEPRLWNTYDFLTFLQYDVFICLLRNSGKLCFAYR